MGIVQGREGPVDAILPVWVLYGPTTRDFPGKVVVRQQWAVPRPPTYSVVSPIGCLYDTVQEAIADCQRLGLTWIGRYEDDDPVILGAFI